MDKIKKFNLELALFVKELNSYADKINEIDDETTNLLIEIALAVNKLQVGSKYRDTSCSSKNLLLHDLNNEIFKCCRFIRCSLCPDQLPIPMDDYDLHIQKESHKQEERKLKDQNATGDETVRESSCESKSSSSCRVNDNQIMKLEPSSSVCSMSDNGNTAPAPETNSTETAKNPLVSEIIDFVSRTEARIGNEMLILKSLADYLKTLETNIDLTPCGSTTYGFGGSTTNFNILVNISEKSPLTLMAKFEKSFQTSSVRCDFEMLEYLSSNRVQKRRYQLMHKPSKILCWLQFDRDTNTIESSQIIRNCIKQSPICFHLIAVVRSLQNVMNKTLAQDGFNTYIIAVLVIFFLQVNYKFPKIKDVPLSECKSIDIIPIIDEKQLKKSVAEFFNFYGKKLEVGKHLISTNIGRWQERHLQAKQSVFTPEQESLRENIDLNPENWKNCTLYVQDIKVPGMNIAAEISEEETITFKTVCQVISSENLYNKTIDDYILQLSKVQPVNPLVISKKLSDATPKSSSSSSLSLGNTTPTTSKTSTSTFSMQSLKTAINNVENSTGSKTSKSLRNIIKIVDVSNAAVAEMKELLKRSQDRIQNEAKIMEILSNFFTKIDSTSKLVPFGSSTYGFGGSRINFNILLKIDTKSSMKTPSMRPIVLIQMLEDSLKTSTLKEDFEILSKVNSNRVQSSQLKIFHKKSRMICVLQNEDNGTLETSSEMIRNFMTLNPICKDLIAYIKALHISLNDIAAKNGLPQLKFNSYMISILVIFFLQLNHDFPLPIELKGMSEKKVTFSSKAGLGAFVKQFLKFYCKNYETTNHLISLNVGRWQEKRQQKSQTIFTDGQKKLRNGIASNPLNWTVNTVMWVEDPISQGKNIMAEISREDANSFIKFCEMFSSHEPKFEQNINCNDKPIISKSVPLSQDMMLFTHIDKQMADIRQPEFLEARRRLEQEIISTLTQYIHKCDASLEIVKFGSCQYDIRGPNTNVNLLVYSRNQINELAKFIFLNLQKTDISSQFKQMHKVGGYRILKSQIHMTHLKSGIQCSLIFDGDDTIAKSSEIIKQYIDKEPMCRFLITYIRTWQNVLRESGKAKFEFNTYIISVLAIFFLQVTQNLPKANEMSNKVPNTTKNISNFKPIARQFFGFYGNSYQIWNHVISAHIGQWQERRTQSKQINFSDAKKRLRKGIEASPANWTNCTMYVQDLMRPDVNITAEITKEASDHFQLMCQTFFKKLPTK